MSDPFLDIIRGLERMEAAVTLEMRDAAEDVADELQRKTEALGAVAIRAFARGWAAEQVSTGLRVSNNADHALWAEYGRKPGRMPPVVAIQEWIDNKGLAMPLSAAWAIARGIAETGTDGAHVLQKARPYIRKRMREAVRRAAAKVIR